MGDWRRYGWILASTLLLIGCAAPAAPDIAAASEGTPTPPPIPTDFPLTPTPSNTPTITPIPSPTLTRTPWPTRTPLSSSSNRRARVPARYRVHLSGVGQHLRAVYELGQTLGRNRGAFSKVGDCQSVEVHFMQGLESGDYVLGEYVNLQGVLNQFLGSYRRVGPSALDGNHPDILLNPLWADANRCDDGENSLQCEIRLHNPSIAIIFIQPRVTGTNWQVRYHDGLTQAVQQSLDMGVIPVLSTLFGWQGHDTVVEMTNSVVKQVGAEMNVPVWDFYRSVEDLPTQGDRGNWHMTLSPTNNLDFSDPANFKYAMVLRNFEALQVLDIVWREVMY
jgi:hypothetical protein